MRRLLGLAAWASEPREWAPPLARGEASSVTCGDGERSLRRAPPRGSGDGTPRRRSKGRPLPSPRLEEAWCCERLHSERDQDELLLLFEQGLKRALGAVLSVEELPVQLRGLLAELLEGHQVLLGRVQGLRQPAGLPDRSSGSRRDRRTERWESPGCPCSGVAPFGPDPCPRSDRPGIGAFAVGRRIVGLREPRGCRGCHR